MPVFSASVRSRLCYARARLSQPQHNAALVLSYDDFTLHICSFSIEIAKQRILAVEDLRNLFQNWWYNAANGPLLSLQHQYMHRCVVQGQYMLVKSHASLHVQGKSYRALCCCV